MKALVAAALLLALLGRADAQRVSTEPHTIQSASGQFLAYAPAGSLPQPISGATPGLMSFDPALLVISCERIKQALARELGSTEPWRGKIHLHVRRTARREPITIIAQPVARGWGYRVELPTVMEKEAFIRAIVQVALMEMAGRNADTRTPEIPLWLSQGLSEELLALNTSDLVPQQPHLSENGVTVSRHFVEARRQNPLEQSLATLRSHPPLTFEQLSWPAVEQFSSQTAGIYRGSAQLFVHQLLELKDGSDCMRKLLREMPRHLNWQLAFMTAYRSHFETPLDVEKWWALQLVQFTGRDLTQTWTAQESWTRLDDIIFSTAEVRSTPDELPSRTQVTLQTIIQDWSPDAQRQVLERKLQELDMARLRVSQEVIPVVDGYRQAIGSFLQKRNSRSGAVFPFLKRSRRIADATVEETVRDLNALDLQRQSLRTPSPLAQAMEE